MPDSLQNDQMRLDGSARHAQVFLGYSAACASQTVPTVAKGLRQTPGATPVHPEKGREQ